MKYSFYTLLIFSLLFSSCSDDDNSEITTIRVNHFKDTTFVSFFGTPATTIAIQRDDEIGGDTFYPSSVTIEGFEYELEFIYDLEVRITEIENPPADGPSTKTTLLNILSKTAVPSETQFKVRLTLNRQDGEFINWVNTDGTNYAFANSEITLSCRDLCDELATKIENKEQITGLFIHGEGDQYTLQEILNE